MLLRALGLVEYAVLIASHGAVYEDGDGLELNDLNAQLLGQTNQHLILKSHVLELGV